MATTQRAYTLRLSATSREPDQVREASHLLWHTHLAVNQGARVFGDWLLTLRGGLDDQLADAPVRIRKGERPPAEDERRNRRVLLALSWLSVESASGAAAQHVLPRTETGWMTLQALREILQHRGLSAADIASWVQDCAVSLEAAIRDDAVWVNRSAAFDAAVATIGGSLNREETWDLLGPFFGDTQSYLALGTPKAAEGDEEDAGNTVNAGGEKAKDLVQKAGQWLSSRFGQGRGADFNAMASAYDLISAWADHHQAGGPMSGDTFIAELCHALGAVPVGTTSALKTISRPGPQSATGNLITKYSAAPSVSPADLTNLAQKAMADAAKCRATSGRKGHRDWADALLRDVEAACGFTYLGADGEGARHSEFAVMLDHAARRVSALHSWIKLAELRRGEFARDADRIHRVPPAAREWLDGYCAARSNTSGAVEAYRIRRRAHQGWEQVVDQWAMPQCHTEEDRVAAARSLQSDPELKFGDIQLFEALAADHAITVWGGPGVPTPEALLDYAAARDAEHNQWRFKIPRYCHPDPLLHPVFCDFGNSRWQISFAVHRNNRGAGARNKVNLRVLQNGRFANLELLWHSKRLSHDLALDQEPSSGDPVVVARADRLGRAARAATLRDPVKIAGLFEEKDWNGRLQAPRKDLNAVARLRDDNSIAPDKKAELVQRRLAAVRWLVSFSAKLQPSGPWADYAASREISALAPHKEVNKTRSGHQAKLILCRLPGLRVLSVDLGHRYAAACAVWETVTTAEVEQACVTTGQCVPEPDALYCHLKHVGRSSVYRRTGADMWARLDRQFVIKLDGEDEPARKASPAELQAVTDVEQKLGYQPEERPARVDELMRYALRMLRLALRRHATVARITINLSAQERCLSGGRSEPLTAASRVAQLTDILYDWYTLAYSTRWAAFIPQKLWTENIVPLLGDVVLPAPNEAASIIARRKALDALRSALGSVAQRFAASDLGSIRRQWFDYWQTEDTRWRCRLRWMRRWVLARGKRAKTSEIRTVGGLSVGRLENVRAMYQLQKAYFGRLVPDATRGPQTRTVAGNAFAQRTLDALERLRENRVKQLSSRIIAAALGLDKNLTQRFPACHAIVIENLGEYSPDQTRSRRENRQLMAWCKAKVRKYLEENSELYGLYLRAVSPAYTSQQDSRTGAPGIRCRDVPVAALVEPAGYWAAEIAAAQRRATKNGGDVRARFIVDVCARLQTLSVSERKELGHARIPYRGGEVFVSADPCSPAAQGMQADLNAAANIGLKALLDPDWPGRWWYVPCDSRTLKPLDKSTKGSTAMSSQIPFTLAPGEALDAKNGRPVNLWQDLSGENLTSRLWMTYGHYRAVVEQRAVAILRRQFEARCSTLTDVPF